MNPSHHPPVLGLFQKRIEGDDSLLALARMRFEQADLGAEIYAGHPDELEHLLRFKPANDHPVVAHLPREIDLLDQASRARVAEFARRFAGRVMGMVVHDQPEMVSDPQRYLDGVRQLNAELESTPDSPWLFVEYAVGLEPDAFVGFAKSIAPFGRTSVCVDVGHVGIWQTRAAFAVLHRDRDACEFKPDHPGFPARVADIQLAVATALPTVIETIGKLGATGKPVHFHLHDGHPSSTFSRYGVADHLGFFTEIPLPFEHDGRTTLSTLFGPAGLKHIVIAAVEVLGTGNCSFTLEIHDPAGQRPLEDAAHLFSHWRDHTNAERMNHWMAVLRENRRLIHDALAERPAAALAAG